MPIAFTPFRVRVPEPDLADLRTRLAATRWPAPTPAAGVPLQTMQQLLRYWSEHYDWRATEARLNAVPQYLATIDGLPIHFLHARSPHPDPLPLILTHGWPGSVLELLGLVDPLTRHGFDVVIPSLPGYGFSGRPATPGWGIERIAAAWAELMAALGYSRYGAAGSDWGTSISSCLAVQDPGHVLGIHLVPPLAAPEGAARAELQERARHSSAYSDVHRTAPLTVAYALNDSPAGLCAWMAEKLLAWSEPGALTYEQILDQVTLYWLTGTAASAANLYAESMERVSAWITGADTEPVHVPVGASIFRAEVPRPSRRSAERRYPDIRYWAEHDRGGHFPALEAPDLLVTDLRTFFARCR